MGKNQHVVPNNGRWGVRGEGNSRLTSTHDTQLAAINAAKPIAQRNNAGVVIHRPNGQIRDSDSYGNESPARDNKH
jgi:hypothetical protein